MTGAGSGVGAASSRSHHDGGAKPEGTSGSDERMAPLTRIETGILTSERAAPP